MKRCWFLLTVPTTSLVHGLSTSAFGSTQELLGDSPSQVLHTISHGGVAVLPNWLPPDLVHRMRRDAQTLFANQYFVPDGLTNTALSKSQQGFTVNADRQTFRGGEGWDDPAAGDVATRRDFAARMRALRERLATGLQRPSLADEGVRKHEMTYNWYQPGAKLGRHLDEHHEETKGTQGWQMPTRRSVTWLVYLNQDWTTQEGGALHTFPRPKLSEIPVGAHDGNLQVGWLEEHRPVFLDAWRPSGQTALYEVNAQTKQRILLSRTDFDVPRQPIDFSNYLKPEYVNDFEQISTARKDPRFAANGAADASTTPTESLDSSVYTLDIVPAAGTLVLFDSVTVPHLVQQVMADRPRIAATGWFHEDSQSLPTELI